MSNTNKARGWESRCRCRHFLEFWKSRLSYRGLLRRIITRITGNLASLFGNDSGCGGYFLCTIPRISSGIARFLSGRLWYSLTNGLVIYHQWMHCRDQLRGKVFTFRFHLKYTNVIESIIWDPFENTNITALQLTTITRGTVSKLRNVIPAKI